MARFKVTKREVKEDAGRDVKRMRNVANMLRGDLKRGDCISATWHIGELQFHAGRYEALKSLAGTYSGTSSSTGAPKVVNRLQVAFNKKCVRQ